MPQSSQTSTDFYRLENNKNLSVFVRFRPYLSVCQTQWLFFSAYFIKIRSRFSAQKTPLTPFVRGRLLYYITVNYNARQQKRFACLLNKDGCRKMADLLRYIIDIIKTRAQKKGEQLMKKNKKIRMIDNAARYVELLKEGKVKSCDFTTENLKMLLSHEEVNVEDFPLSVKKDLMLKQLIPADFRSLDASGQLELLLCDKWYGSDSEISAQLAWDEFSPDELVSVVKYHPGYQRYCPADIWKKVADAGKKVWLTCLVRHHSFAEYCPERVWKSFTVQERFHLVLAKPGFAGKLDVSDFSRDMCDILLRRHPELAGHFDLEKPGELFFFGNLDNCSKKESELVANFLIELLDIPFAEGFEMASDGGGLLGIYSCHRGELLKMQIKEFLQDNDISNLALDIDWKELPQPLFKPADNLEVQILKHCKGGIVQACFEDEKLSRPDVLWTAEFANLRNDIGYLVLMKALPEEFHSSALAGAFAEDCSCFLISQMENVFKFRNQPSERGKYEQLLLDAVNEREWTIANSLAESVQLQSLTLEEAESLRRRLPEKMMQKFFDKALSPVLRAYLLTELAESDTGNNGKLINILLTPFWKNPDDDDFCDFQAED